MKLWNYSNNIKLHDRVIIKSKDIEGFIDTVTPDHNYRVRTKEGYEWCRIYELV